MATLETEIKTVLTDDATTAAIIAGRIYRRRVPAGGEYPCVVLTRDKTERLNFSDGLDPLVKASEIVTCWSDDPEELEDLRDAVAGCLADYTGGTPVKVHESTLVEESDIDAGPSKGTDDTIMLGKRMTFRFWFEILTA